MKNLLKKKFLFSKKNIKKFLDNVILSRSLSDAKIGTFLSRVGSIAQLSTKCYQKKKNFPLIQSLFQNKRYL